MSTLLYQKYRAKTFSEMVGNFKTVTELKFRAKEKNIPQTILLSGNSGTGKTTLQRIVSKALTCSNLSPEGEPCNQCSDCEDINSEHFVLSCYEYNGAEIGKQQVLEIEERANTVSLHSSCKIFIIDEFQGLFVNTDKALDTLLKIIEKPYKDTYFILGTMDIASIQAHAKGKAVLNRCSVYRMQDLGIQDMGKALALICRKERISLDEVKSNIVLDIAEHSNGSLRTAISLLERCIYSNIWTKEELQSELGIIGSKTISELIDKLLAGDLTLMNNSSFNRDLIPQIRSYLLILYKELNSIPSSYIPVNISPKSRLFSKDIVFKALTLFNELKTVYNLDYITFESKIINFMQEIQKTSLPDNSKKDIPETVLSPTVNGRRRAII